MSFASSSGTDAVVARVGSSANGAVPASVSVFDSMPACSSWLSPSDLAPVVLHDVLHGPDHGTGTMGLHITVTWYVRLWRGTEG